MRKRLIGLPGTGKTTKLLQILEMELLQEYPPEEIIYCSFSNAAVNEAKERVLRKFSHIKPDQLKYFRTMHSLCLRLIKDRQNWSGKKPSTMGDFRRFLYQYRRNNPTFDELLDDFRISVAATSWFHTEVQQNPISKFTLGSKPEQFFSHLFNIIRTSYEYSPMDGSKFIPYVSQLYDRLDLTKKEFRKLYTHLIKLESAWIEYKDKEDLFEFSELLVHVLKYKLVPKVSVLIVDEYQDSSKLQSEIVDLWSESMNLTIVAGDPNQAIYGFNGASPVYLEDFDNDETILLNKTWRCPQNIVNYAKEILNNPWTKNMQSATDKEGQVFAANLTEIVFDNYDKVFILARNNYILDMAKTELQSTGRVFLYTTDKIVTNLYRLWYCIEFEKSIRGRILADILKATGKRSYDLFDYSARNFLVRMMKEKKTDQLLSYEILLTLLGCKSDQNTKKWISQKIDRIITFEQRELLFQLKNASPDPDSLNNKKFEFMTMHASKGKEADLVVIIDAASWYEEQGLADEEEEYRVHFVAVTRTKNDLAVVTLDKDVSPTQFLPEISQTLTV